MKNLSRLQKLIILLWQAFPFILKSVWFNFHYFPFKQAIKCPVLFLSRSTVKLKGKCIIHAPFIKFGMIKLGFNFHTNRPNTGFFFCNNGGTIVFNGYCLLGQSCSITIGEKGCLEIGDNVLMSYGGILYAYHSIKIKDDVRIGWETLMTDTSFHTLKMLDGRRTKGYGSIEIGNNVWISSYCRVFANTRIPDYCIIGSGSFVNKDYSSIPSYSLLAGNPVQIKKRDIYRDMSDDQCVYE